jgi:hypothetical protein
MVMAREKWASAQNAMGQLTRNAARATDPPRQFFSGSVLLRNSAASQPQSLMPGIGFGLEKSVPDLYTAETPEKQRVGDRELQRMQEQEGTALAAPVASCTPTHGFRLLSA